MANVPGVGRRFRVRRIRVFLIVWSALALAFQAGWAQPPPPSGRPGPPEQALGNPPADEAGPPTHSRGRKAKTKIFPSSPVEKPRGPSRALPPVRTPDTEPELQKRRGKGKKGRKAFAADPAAFRPAPAALSTAPAALSTASAAFAAAPVELRLLVLAASGDEPSFEAAQNILDRLSVPYDAVVASQQPLPALTNSSGDVGRYQGVILATGNLGICDPQCRSALSAEDWTTLDLYMADFGVRMASLYTWPEPRYGFNWGGVGVSTVGGPPKSASFQPDAGAVFPDLRQVEPIEVVEAFLYLGELLPPAAGESNTVLLTVEGAPAGVVHAKADGREYLALTFDQSRFVMHSQILGYGLVNWLTHGIFLGERRVYLAAQADDLFLENDLYDETIPGCQPSGFQENPTVDPSRDCPTLRISGSDLNGLAAWQAAWRQQPQTRDLRISLPFNGRGASTEDGLILWDSLTVGAQTYRNAFHWINHTYDHENLDCYDPVPGSGVCTPATYNQSKRQVNKNRRMARQLGLPEDVPSMVTPNLSGLGNRNFLRAARDLGVRYLVTDRASLGIDHPPNTFAPSPATPRISLIPRHATNIFYNVTTGEVMVSGSEPDEYNYFYGPDGISKAPDGSPWFSEDSTWEEIVDRESDAVVRQLWSYEAYPIMFHQSNLHLYDGVNSLMSEMIHAALEKFTAVSNAPVLSPSQTAMGETLTRLAAFRGAGVTAVLTPGSGITITATRYAKVPVTGVCYGQCTSYGGQSHSLIPVMAGQSVHVPIQ